MKNLNFSFGVVVLARTKHHRRSTKIVVLMVLDELINPGIMLLARRELIRSKRG